MFQGTSRAAASSTCSIPQTGHVSQSADAVAPPVLRRPGGARRRARPGGRRHVDAAAASGIADNTAFNWQTRQLEPLAPMHYPRWYATATTLADGKVLVTSGSNRTSTDIVPIPELYSPETNTGRSSPRPAGRSRTTRSSTSCPTAGHPGRRLRGAHARPRRWTSARTSGRRSTAARSTAAARQLRARQVPEGRLRLRRRLQRPVRRARPTRST